MVFDKTVDERMQYLESVYETIKFNRFINKIVNKRSMQKNRILQIDNPKMTIGQDLPSHTRIHTHTFTASETDLNTDVTEFLGARDKETGNIA